MTSTHLTRPTTPDRPGEESALARAVRQKALDWLATHRLDFGRFLPGQIPSEPAQTAISELALFLWVMQRDRHDSRSETALALLGKALRDIYGHAALRAFVETGPPQAAIGHVFIWLAVRSRGGETLMPRERLIEILATRNVIGTPRPPVRFAELRLALDAIGMPHDLPDWHEFGAVSRLGELLSSSARPDLYEATHWIFYLSDFGRRPLECAAELSELCARRVLERAVARDWDLVAEFILAGYCLTGSTWRVEVEAGWQALSGAQTLAGDFANPAVLAASPGQSRFMRQYHKCLVVAWAGLAGACARPVLARP